MSRAFFFRFPSVKKRIVGARAFAANEEGVTAAMVGLILPAILLAVAAAVDMAQITRYKAALDAAADSAALSGVSPGIYDATKSGSVQKTISETASLSAFRAEAPASGVTLQTITAAYTAPSGGLAASMRVSYVATVKSIFGNLGFSWLTVSGASVANPASQLASYTNLYILIDVSGSMGLGVDIPTQTAMTKDPSVGNCAFACHDPSWDTAVVARTKGYVLRFDAVKAQVLNLLDNLRKQYGSTTSPLKVAIYAFDNQFRQVSALGSDMTLHRNAVSTLDFSIVDSGTSIRHALVELKKVIPQPGDGSAASKAKATVLFISDGLANSLGRDASNKWTISSTAYPPFTTTRCWNQTQPPQNGPYFPPVGPPDLSVPCIADYVAEPQRFQQILPIDPAWCADLKNYGVRVMTMYSRYDFPVPETSSTSWDTGQWRYPLIYYYLLPRIPGAMAACASSTGDSYSIYDVPSIQAGFTSAMNSAIPNRSPRLVK